MDLPIPPDIPRVALVTGGARRLGRAIALALAEAGFDLALHHRGDAGAAEATAAEIRALGRRAVTLRADLSREAEVATLIPRAAGALGPVGVLVNNASAFERDEWHDATRESWDAHLEPNLRAPFVLAQALARQLPEAAEALVLNMLDERVWSLTPHFMSYTVSKSALWTLTQTLALALAPRVRVVGIGPGPALPSPRQSEAQFRAQCAATPLRRGTGPEEVARAAIALLALPSVTGQMLALDGGQHLQWSPARGAGWRSDGRPALLRPDAARGLRRVFLRDLVLDAGIGVYAHEIGVAQKLVVCLEALVQEKPGIGEDRLHRVVDYDALAEAARAAVRNGHVRLIETVAERIAAGMLEADPRVVQVMVTIEKPGAVPDAAASGVSVERFRDG